MSFKPTGVETSVATEFEALSAERKKLQAQGLLPDWYTTQAWQMFKSKYIVESEGSLRARHQKIAHTLARHVPQLYRGELEKAFFDLMWNGILSPATPALANTGTDRGMPVSCSGQVVADSIDGFYSALRETAILSKYGFGTSADFSDIRPRGAKISTGGIANGAKEVIDDFFTCTSKVSQGGNRRGSVGAYLDIEHGDFYECLNSLKTDPNGKNYGWIIKDSFVEKLKAGDAEANQRFEDAVHVKMLTGKGYLYFIDKANRHRPVMYKDRDLMLKASNLCTEIMLHSSKDLTYSCILSSLNLVHWDKIKTSKAVFYSTIFLDCLCSEFIEVSDGIVGLEKVRDFTIKGRAIGLGVMGLSTYFQSKRIPYESLEAQFIDQEIFKHIHDESLKASQWMAEIMGEPEWCKGHGVRNTHRTAIAPTKSTALLMGGVSESWFPDPGMVFEASSAAGQLSRIVPEIYKLMQERGVYSAETINDIINHVGSVQHVDWLDDHEKQVFKTAFEMDQRVLLRRASLRQKHICQGQSLNFFVPEDGSEDLISELMTRCVLDEEILSVYYVYSRSGVVVKDECLSCQA